MTYNAVFSSFTKGRQIHNISCIEFVCRGHLNDLENILPFMMISFFYMLSDPSQFVAINLFRAFTVARILHTFVYTIVIVPQPSRGLAWVVGYAVTIYMAVSVLLSHL
jgi:glutathione S-transferase